MTPERRRAISVLGGGLAAIVLLVVLAAWLAPVVAEIGAMDVERGLLSWFGGWSGPGVDLVLREAGQLSEGAVLLFLVTVLAVVFRRSRPRYAVMLIFAYGGSFVIHWVGKVVVERPRPRLTDWPDHLASGSSYPSGHAVEAAAVYAVLAWILPRMEPRLPAAVAWCVAAILIMLAGVNRLYLGLHWPTDVLVGWVAGLLWAAALIAAGRGTGPSQGRDDHPPAAAGTRGR